MRRLSLSPLNIISLTILCLVNVGLMIWLYAMAVSSTTTHIPLQKWEPDAGIFASIQLSTPDNIQNYADILARPVFFEKRRPYTPPPPVPAKVTRKPQAKPQPKPVRIVKPPVPRITKPEIHLRGIAIVDQTPRAYLISPRMKDGIWSKVGEIIQGWKLVEISSEAVTLEKAGKTFELLLYQNEYKKSAIKR